MTAHTEDMVLVPQAELDALRAENRRLRREAGDREALKRVRSDAGGGRAFTREELAAAWGISERPDSPLTRQGLGRAPGTSAAVAERRSQGIFHPLAEPEEPVPALAEPFPGEDPLPGAYRLHIPSDGLTIQYKVTDSLEGRSSSS